jgi:hypothetical protein
VQRVGSDGIGSAILACYEAAITDGAADLALVDAEEGSYLTRGERAGPRLGSRGHVRSGVYSIVTAQFHGRCFDTDRE